MKPLPKVKCPAISLCKARLRQKRKNLARRIKRKNDPEFAEKLRQINRQYLASLTSEQVKEFKKKKAEKDREIYLANGSLKNNLKRKKSRDKNKERENARRRTHYRANNERMLDQIKIGKRRRDPTIGLVATIKSFATGRASVSELIERLELADQRVDEKFNFSAERC